MRLFRLQGDTCVATIERAEAATLRDLVHQIRGLLASRSENAPQDPLTELTGITTGSATPPEDPALARLLPNFSRDDDDLSAALRMLHEPEVIAAKDDAAATLLATLPGDGGRITLNQGQARAWLISLGDIRLVFGVRLGITDDDTPPEAAEADPRSPQYAMFLVYQWISAVQESLVQSLLEAHRGAQDR